MDRFLPVPAATMLLAALGGAAAAQDGPAPGPAAPALSIELNAVEQQPGSCRLVFVAENRMGADLSALVLEAVLFDRAGNVTLLTLLDFGGLPAARTRVRQFDLAGADCAGLGRVLLNDVNACGGAGLSAESCRAALRWSSRTDVEVVG